LSSSLNFLRPSSKKWGKGETLRGKKGKNNQRKPPLLLLLTRREGGNPESKGPLPSVLLLPIFGTEEEGCGQRKGRGGAVPPPLITLPFFFGEEEKGLGGGNTVFIPLQHPLGEKKGESFLPLEKKVKRTTLFSERPRGNFFPVRNKKGEKKNNHSSPFPFSAGEG